MNTIKNEENTVNREKVRLIRNRKVIGLYIGMFILFTLAFSFVPMATGDDTNVRRLVLEKGLWNWLLNDRYMSWSSRLFADFSGGVFLTNPLFLWAIVNAFMLCLLTYSIVKVIKPTVTVEDTCLVIFLILAMDWLVAKEGIVWITGSFNYLWVTALAVYSFLYIVKLARNESMTVIEKASYYVAMILACYGVEQVPLCLFGFSLCSLFVVKGKDKWKVLVYLCIIGVNIGVILMAPGNEIRTVIETAHFYPNFGELSIGQKVGYGFTWEIQNMLKLTFPYIIMFLIYVGVDYFKGKLSLVTTMVYYIAILMAYIYGFIALILGNTKAKFLVEFKKYDEWVNIKEVIPYIIVIVFFLSVIILMIDMSENRLIGAVLVASIICCPIPLYFSPTIYGSGLRTYFVPLVLVVIYLVWIMKRCSTENKVRAVMVISGFTLINMIYLIINMVM